MGFRGFWWANAVFGWRQVDLQHLNKEPSVWRSLCGIWNFHHLISDIVSTHVTNTWEDNGSSDCLRDMGASDEGEWVSPSCRQFSVKESRAYWNVGHVVPLSSTEVAINSPPHCHDNQGCHEVNKMGSLKILCGRRASASPCGLDGPPVLLQSHIPSFSACSAKSLSSKGQTLGHLALWLLLRRRHLHRRRCQQGIGGRQELKSLSLPLPLGSKASSRHIPPQKATAPVGGPISPPSVATVLSVFWQPLHHPLAWSAVRVVTNILRFLDYNM